VPKHAVKEPEPPKVVHRPGVLVAEATLQPNGIQDLADVIPDLIKAAVGHELKFGVRIELGGETPPSQEVAEAVNGVLAEVAADLKLT
jgi:hypothetical protein